MKKILLVASLLIFQHGALAFSPNTPGPVAMFITIAQIMEKINNQITRHPDFAQRSWEQLEIEEKYTIFKKLGLNQDRKAFNQVCQLLELLPQLAAEVLKDPEFMAFIPYGCRRFLPGIRSIPFKEYIPFNFHGDKKILAIGGTGEEIQELSRHHGLNAANICAINVLPDEGAHYMADMYNPEHMHGFFGRFDFAFMSAVPLDPDKVRQGFRNIANSLNEHGILIAYSSDLKDGTMPLLLQNGFASVKTIFEDPEAGVAWFIASKFPCDDLDRTVKSNPIGSGIYNYVTQYLDYHKGEKLKRYQRCPFCGCINH